MWPEAPREYCLKIGVLTATMTLVFGVGAVRASSLLLDFFLSPVPEGASLAAPFNVTDTLGNGDEYQVTGSATATNLSNTTGLVTLLTNLTVTYLGNNGSSTSSVSADTITVDFQEAFPTPTFGVGSNNSGFEAFQGMFSGTLGTGSSAKGQLSSNGTAMSPMGPFVPPGPFSTLLTNQPFAFGPTTTLDFVDTFVFGASSAVNASITASDVPAVPEPASLVLLGSGLVLGVRQWCKGRRKPTNV
jgi:hypothetical protein